MRRSGLRTRMAVSYVLVTAAAVVLVEAVLLGVLHAAGTAGNAARHGEPGSILVLLSQRTGSVAVEVRDDGRGFDPSGVGNRHGMGLTLMRERVTELGGDFRLDTAPGT